MATNETTTFVGDKMQTGDEKKNVQQNENGWQSVTIGGVTGILMGAGAMYAATAFGKKETVTGQVDPAAVDEAGSSSATPEKKSEEVSSHVAENGLKVAEVDQNLSFGQAFQAAREAVGPGGVFHWHGGIYNTYRLEEWNAMSGTERQQFALQVKPEIQPGEEHTGHKHDIAHNDVKHDEPEERKPEGNDKPKPDDSHDTKPEEAEKQDAEGEVHFLGFTNVKLEGHEYEAGHMSARVGGEERHVYFVDLDHAPDNEFDIGLVDRDSDGEFTLREAFDARESHINVDKFSLASSMDEANQQSEAEINQASLTTQDGIANDMPDYANDANPII